MKKQIFKILIILFLGLGLVGCEFNGTYNPGYPNVPVPDNYPHKVSLDLCSFDSYKMDASLLKDAINNYQFVSENNVVCSVNSLGVITTYSEGTGSILATHSIDQSLNTEITVNSAKGLKVDYIDVGQGDAILVILPNDETMLIDVGAGLYYDEVTAWNNIQKVLASRGIGVIEHLVITHNHGDHYAFVPRIIKNYKVENVYGSGSVRTTYEYLNIMQSIKTAGLTYAIVEVGDYLVKTDDLSVQVVGVQKDLTEDDGNPNYNSVMIKVKYKNVAYMFTGDAGYQTGDCENIALKSGIDLQADVLKVGHHGSAYSSGNSFLKAVKPKIAIITTAKNSETGHPHASAVNRIKLVGATIYESAVHGTISVSTNGYNIYVQTEKGL